MQITEIPSWLAGSWEITEAVAQIILSVAVLAMVMLPIFLLTRGKSSITMQIFFFFLTECVLVGIGWCPFWILIGTVLMASLAFAAVGNKAISGG